MTWLILTLGIFAFQDSNLRGIKASEKEKPDYYALLIGVQKYQDPKIADLQTPVADITAIAEVLDRRYHFKKTTLLMNEEATEAGIRATLENFVKEADSEDSLLIYYAGHGDKGDALSGFWLPHDSVLGSTDTYISNNDIVGYLNGSKARHVFLISDSCFSGSLFINSSTRDNPLAYYGKFQRNSRMVLTSGNYEPVMDTGPSKKHSAFAYYLLKCLNEKKEAYLTPSEILQAISAPVLHQSKGGQLPRGERLEGDKGGSFVFWNREGSLADGSPAPPPWENPDSDMVFHLKSKLKGRKAWVVNGDNPKLCEQLTELGMVVDCDLDYPGLPTGHLLITCFCGQINAETIAALKEYLGLTHYGTGTHNNQPSEFAPKDCGTSGEITIWN